MKGRWCPGITAPPPSANRPYHSALPNAKGVHVGLTHTLGVEDSATALARAVAPELVE